MQFDIVLIITLVIAVVVFLQLRNVLGKRTGFERPPFDPYTKKPKQENKEAPADDEPMSGPMGRPMSRPMSGPVGGDMDNVISLPRREMQKVDEFAAIDAIAAEGSELNKGLRAIIKVDPSFAPKSFLDGVRVAYEMIVTNFANADRKALKSLLSTEMYDGFCDAINQREAANEKVKFTFVGIDALEIKSAEVQGNDLFLTLYIASEIISATYGDKDVLVDGDPEAIVEIKDVWTFSRNSRLKDPNWKLVATESA